MTRLVKDFRAYKYCIAGYRMGHDCESFLTDEGTNSDAKFRFLTSTKDEMSPPFIYMLDFSS